MKNLAHDSHWRGLVRPIILLSSILICNGCASFPSLRPDAHDHLDFLTQALIADPQTRESMWKASQNSDNSYSAKLRRALLRSVPKHSGYDPMMAEANLGSLIQQVPATDIGAVARARLAELKADAACRNEVDTLKLRLSKMVDIERRINNEGH